MRGITGAFWDRLSRLVRIDVPPTVLAAGDEVIE
jgi:hypothetical protein